MYRPIRLALAAAAVGGLAVATATPAAAQTEPTLGFEIDKTEGSPGDEVAGQVDVDDVAANCATTVEELQPRFTEFAMTVQGLQDVYFPEGPGEFTNYEQVAWSFTGLIGLGVGGSPELAQQALPQTFLMTFAEIATQQPVGERANFDPAVGQATVTVPDVEPGLWAVAATCVHPTLDTATIQAAISQTAAFLEDEGVPLDFQNTPEFDLLAFLQENAPTILEPVMVPRALGFQLFCVLDASGACPADEQPPTPPAPPPGDDGDDGAPGVPQAPPARPVVAQPTFTG